MNSNECYFVLQRKKNQDYKILFLVGATHLTAQDNDIFYRKTGIFGNFPIGQQIVKNHPFGDFTISIGNTFFNLRIDIVSEFLEEATPQGVMVPDLVIHIPISLELFL